MADRKGYRPIEDYAIIGDCRSAALISRHGSIDWLCWPIFDSPSVFAALLDREKGGSFSVRPVAGYETERRYIEETNILETIFKTDRGRLRLVDLMPVASEVEKRRELLPEHQVLRRIECLDGEVEVEVTCDPRPHYAQEVPRLRRVGELGYFHTHGAEALLVRSEIALEPRGTAPGVQGRETLRAGDRRHISLVFTDGEPAVIPTFGSDAERKIERSVNWWKGWAARCAYEGPYRSEVLRSALVLKLMTYAPSGAVVAAPTTSLPEWIGGVRNWDYRYCWLRDASLTLQALVDLGYDAEAEGFLSWMLHSTRMTAPELQVLYDVHGETRLPERELPHLEGYARSAPVRVGNAADGQLQLDTYGEVVDAVYEFVRRNGRLDRATRRVLLGLGDVVCRRWREPDEGIWETRGGPKHHTYSKAMCWVALDRLLRLREMGHLNDAPAERFEAERRAIRQEVEQHGFDPELQSYTCVFDSRALDASLLQLARYGYVEPDSPRFVSTCRRILERLGRNGLLYRYVAYDDGLPAGEGAFGICSFWAVDCLTRQGAVDEAAERFEHVCSFANDVGLFAEEIDPESGAQLGNFPQAFTHVGLIDAALTLAERTGRAVRQPVRSEAREIGATE